MSPPWRVCRSLAVVIAVAALALGITTPAWALMSVSIRPVGGSPFSLTVSATDTVLSVKQQIESLHAIPVAEQRLIHSGVQMEDRKALADYNVQPASTVL